MTNPKLKLSSKYTRKDIHGIFAPEANYTPGSGTWGIHGFIPIPETTNDYVFISTFGQKDLGYEFKEYISDNGIMVWQSQKKQRLDDRHIQKWIYHDELVSNIHFFLRANDKDSAWTYMGKLKYLNHDSNRQQPVHFQWQLINWSEYTEENNIYWSSIIEVSNKKIEKKKEATKKGLNETRPPIPKEKKSKLAKNSFDIRVKPDYSAIEQKNRKLGLAGEELVVTHEQEKLKSSGHHELARKVLHVAKEQGDGAGYDIKSFSDDGSPIYIEVKTTEGGKQANFFMSAKERLFAQEHPESFRLYRLYEYQKESESAKIYILDAKGLEMVEFSAVSYRVNPNIKD
jgi:hypothetical protein